jgi:hypothetical protein
VREREREREKETKDISIIYTIMEIQYVNYYAVRKVCTIYYNKIIT